MNTNYPRRIGAVLLLIVSAVLVCAAPALRSRIGVPQVKAVASYSAFTGEAVDVVAARVTHPAPALYLTKAELLTTLKRSADQANLQWQLALRSESIDPSRAAIWREQAARWKGQEEAFLIMFDYVTFLTATK